MGRRAGIFGSTLLAEWPDLEGGHTFSTETAQIGLTLVPLRSALEDLVYFDEPLL